jgi:glycerate 2-kinase
VVIAPDSFKGTLSARLAADAMARGWLSVRPDDALTLLPQADGGEGTLDAIEAATTGCVRHVVPGVSGPDGRPVTAEWLELRGGVAVVELAQSSGLPLMAAPDPLGATTRGLGDVIAAALDFGAQTLVIALGGSASTDGGVGALEALGLRIADGSVDRRSLRAAPPGGVTLLTDVSAPLLGPHGTAAVFGPQKGATADDVRELETRLSVVAGVFGGDPAHPGAGAAGGTAYGLAAVWGATITSGADFVAELTGLDAALADADVALTGEGRFDAQSVGGKVVGRVLSTATGRTVVIAGALERAAPDLAYSLTDLAGSQESALAHPENWIEFAAAAAARELAPTKTANRTS